MAYAKQEHFILVIDEFQDLQAINPSFFSQMQQIWDAREPLFGRATARINLQPFTPSVCKKILGDFNPSYTSEDLLCLYMLSGGVAKYVFLLMESGSVTKDKMIDYVTSMTSPFLIDGKDMLVSEMGKDYGVYFSILALISRGMATQREIDSIIQKNTVAYLANLEKKFNVIKAGKPLFSRAESRNARWQITDCYLRFYFRFIYANQSLVELGQLDVLKQLILREYEMFTGKTLEAYFTAKINEERELTNIGGWRARKGESEIDIIALNSLAKTCHVYEVKRQAEKIDLSLFAKKVDAFKSFLKTDISGFSFQIAGLSMEDMGGEAGLGGEIDHVHSDVFPLVLEEHGHVDGQVGDFSLAFDIAVCKDKGFRNCVLGVFQYVVKGGMELVVLSALDFDRAGSALVFDDEV